jgi:hypothetical protein
MFLVFSKIKMLIKIMKTNLFKRRIIKLNLFLFYFGADIIEKEIQREKEKKNRFLTFNILNHVLIYMHHNFPSNSTSDTKKIDF